MTIDEKKMREVLESLNQNQLSVLEIYDPENRADTLRYFKTGVLRPADSHTHYHSISQCIDITDILSEQHSQYINSPQYIQSIITAIEKRGMTVSRDFSASFRFVWYK